MNKGDHHLNRPSVVRQDIGNTYRITLGNPASPRQSISAAQVLGAVSALGVESAQAQDAMSLRKGSLEKCVILSVQGRNAFAAMSLADKLRHHFELETVLFESDFQVDMIGECK